MVKFLKISEVRKKKATWLISGLIPNGATSLVSGDPGANKSFLYTDIAARVSRGWSMPFSSIPGKAGGVLILNSEDTVAKIEERFLAAGGDIDRLYVAEKGTMSLPGDIQELREFVLANDIRLVVLDPLESFVEGSIMSRTAVRRVLDPLNRLAEQLDIAIVVVRHLTKSTSTMAQYRGVGSGAITGAVRSELLVAVSPTNPEHRVIVHMKCNLGPLAKSIEFRMKSVGESATIDWLGQCEITAEDALDRPNKRECAALNDAKRLLVAVLFDKPLAANEVKAIARRSGISDATRVRAKYDLGVESKRTGFGKGFNYEWVLPDRDDPRVKGLMDELFGEITADLCHEWKELDALDCLRSVELVSRDKLGEIAKQLQVGKRKRLDTLRRSPGSDGLSAYVQKLLVDKTSLLAKRWAGDTAGLEDGTRSALVMAITCCLIRKYVPTAEVESALRHWCSEHEYEKGKRQVWLEITIAKAYAFVQQSHETARSRLADEYTGPIARQIKNARRHNKSNKKSR